MKLLLDTHAFLWFVLNDSKLGTVAKESINDPNNEVFVSPVTYWEIAIKVGYGKLDLSTSFDEFMDKGLSANNFQILPIEPRHARKVVDLPVHHRDPFDRMLVAQAMIENLALVTSDAAIDSYAVQKIW